MGVTYSQFFPPHPALTEANLPSQQGKVFIVTGGASGVGFELCKILYQAGAKVWLAGRSESNASDAISKIKAVVSKSAGELKFLQLALDDLVTIKPAAEKFMASEARLDVLFLNAGVSNPPKGSVSAQGVELQMATNCLGHYLFTQLLLPQLDATATNSSNPGEVRVVWTSSLVVDMAPKGGGITSEVLGSLTDQSAQKNYTASKVGNWFLAASLADQVGRYGILSVTQNPGNLKTQLTRHLPRWVEIVVAPLLYDAKYGAYTELWAGLSTELDISDGGAYIVPWGRKHPAPRADLLEASQLRDAPMPNGAKAFTEWCEKQVERFG